MAGFSITVRPTWRDQDALGHVNNAVYLTYLESWRAAFWRDLAGDFDRFPFILARVEIDFRAAASWRDNLTVRGWVSRVGTSSFDVTYEIDGAGRRIAEARTVQVMFDHERGVKMPIDGALRAKLDPQATRRRQDPEPGRPPAC